MKQQEAEALRVYPVWIKHCAELIDAILASPFPADRVFRDFFRRQPKLGKRDRAFVAETVYGVLRHYRRLAWSLDSDRPDFRFLVLLYLLHFGFANRQLDLPITSQERVYLEHALHRFRALEHGGVSAETLSIRYSLPEWLVSAWLRQLSPSEVATRCESLKESAPLVIRTNTLKIDRPTLLQRLAEEGIRGRPAVLSPAGIILSEKAFVFRTRAFQQGWFEVQDEGSQLIGFLTEAAPGSVVVDACAGGGGKTLHIAALMRGKGRIYAFDVDGRRLQRLTPRARRAGAFQIRRAILTADRPDQLRRLQGRADVVLCDVPCSGTGVLRRNPDVLWKLERDDVSRLVKTQAEILERFCPLVRPGGRLLYATCSLLQEENEEQVIHFLERHPDFHLASSPGILARLGIPVPGQRDEFLRLEPRTTGTDGFFAAVLLREV